MNRHLANVPPCPVCKGTDVRAAEWVGEPSWVCIDCAVCGAGADSYFDTPKPCPDCHGSRIRHDGYVADDGETYRECATCK